MTTRHAAVVRRCIGLIPSSQVHVDIVEVSQAVDLIDVGRVVVASAYASLRKITSISPNTFIPPTMRRLRWSSVMTTKYHVNVIRVVSIEKV